MKTLLAFIFLLSACRSSSPSEGRLITDPVMQAKAIRYQQKKVDCLKTSMGDDEYLKCVGMKRLNANDLYCEGPNCWEDLKNDQTGLRE